MNKSCFYYNFWSGYLNISSSYVAYSLLYMNKLLLYLHIPLSYLYSSCSIKDQEREWKLFAWRTALVMEHHFFIEYCSHTEIELSLVETAFLAGFYWIHVRRRKLHVGKRVCEVGASPFYRRNSSWWGRIASSSGKNAGLPACYTGAKASWLIRRAGHVPEYSSFICGNCWHRLWSQREKWEMDCRIDGFVGGDLAVLCLYLLLFYANSFLIIVRVPGTCAILQAKARALPRPSVSRTARLLFTLHKKEM